jgi:hypothetical protein
MSRIQTSIHGREVGLDTKRQLLCPQGFVAGDNGSQMILPAPGYVSFIDDFLGGGQALSTTIIDGWRSRKGSDGACVDWTITEAVGGTIAGVIGNTTATMAVSGVQLDRGLDWKANQGHVAVEARVKMSKIANIAVFFGFTDQVAALEMPINSAGGSHTITTNATDGCGFLFDTSDSGTDQWLLVGVANDTDATVQANINTATSAGAAIVPVADTYEVLRVQLATDGSATFYRNGTQVGTRMAGAVTATVALTPVIAAFNRTTSGAGTITADYVAIMGART